MKNKEFFYQQYDKIRWENQEKTKINSFIYDFIIQNIILKKKTSDNNTWCGNIFKIQICSLLSNVSYSFLKEFVA